MRLKITVDGKPYEVEVEVLSGAQARGGRGLDRPAPTLAPPKAAGGAPAGGGAGGYALKSSLAGTVTKVNVEPGADVKAGDTLVVLEAMKMETEVVSPADGKIKAVPVKQGDAVTVDQVLVEFE